MVGYDEFRVPGYDEFRVKDNVLSIRTKEYGPMGMVSIEGVEFVAIPPFEAINKDKFTADEKNKDLLLKAGKIYPENVEKVIGGKIKERDESGAYNEKDVWIIIHRDPKERNKIKITFVAEDGRYATATYHVVETAPTPEKMGGSGFRNAVYTPPVEYEEKTHLEPDRRMPERIL